MGEMRREKKKNNNKVILDGTDFEVVWYSFSIEGMII